jgi:Peptidase family M28
MVKEYDIDSDENSDYMYNYIDKILKEIGPRASGSEEEKRAGELVAKDMKALGIDEVDIEDFTLYPRAFMGWARLLSVIFSIAFLIFLLSAKYSPIAVSLVSFGLCVFALFILYKQFLCYEEWTPKFIPYKKKTSHNVIGTIKPSGEVTKRVVISGHLDSAYTFNLIEYTRQGYAYFIIQILFGFFLTMFAFLSTFIFEAASIDQTFISRFFAWIGFVYPFVSLFVLYVVGRSPKVLVGAVSKIHPITSVIVGYTTVYGILINALFWNVAIINASLYYTVCLLFCQSIPAVIAFFLFVGKYAVPGAIDNLTAVAACMCIGKILNDYKKDYPEKVPQNTEVILAIVGSEEAGLRGSEAFAKKHSEEYNKIDTTCVNFESLSESKVQTIYTHEATTKTDMTKEVYELVSLASEKAGVPFRLGEMPSIAGGTDATGLIRGGLRATTIEGLRYKDYLSYYHTSRDNMTNINKERKKWTDIGPNWHNRNVRAAMEMAVLTMMKYIELKDKE